MKQIHRRISAGLTALAVCGCLMTPLTVSADYGVGGNGTAIMEYLDRGIYAVKSGSGMFVSWRFNADDNSNAEFQLYRDGELIYTSKAGSPTCYQDDGGSANSKYRVDTVVGGKTVSSETCKFTSGANYFDIPMDVPQGGVINGEAYSYSPNDTVVGDVDGDGQYELFVKWDPSNAKDNSQVTNPSKGIQGITGNVYIDCYTLTGQKLWRIDLGRNIRAGQHYTQLCVADFDCDGKAELITKTCDGTKDGTGKVIGDGSKVYVNDAGTVLTGPEYMTLFEGATGKALDTIEFPVLRDASNTAWGDTYGNRCERYNGGIAYLDGVHPTAIYGRGYYTRMTVSAVDVVNSKLNVRWIFDTGYNSNTPGYGDGNHNLMAADVDNDGKQEVCMGATMIDDNGKLLWCTRQGHGDAMHLGDLDPDRAGLELWTCHEHEPWGVSLISAQDGKILYHEDRRKDTGRCAADNVLASNRGAELWGALEPNVMNIKGQTISTTTPAQNFFIYWDGDLERELLDDITITKMTALDKIETVFTATGCASNNGTKAVPCLTADLFGDWREELLLRTEDNTKIRVWCTDIPTSVRLTTLMHDTQYRAQDCCQQSSYNQPPHPSFYLGSEEPLPERPNVIINGQSTDGPPAPASVDTTKTYVLRNVNSNLLLAADTYLTDGTNIVQNYDDAGDPCNLWVLEQADDGAYILHNAGDQNLVLTANSNQVELRTKNGSDAQQFVLYRSGSAYHLTTKDSDGTMCVEVYQGSKTSGGDVQLFEDNGKDHQKWVLEAVSYHPARTVSFVQGDLNKDGKVNAADLTAAKRMLSADKSPDRITRQPGDLNADGALTVADAVLLQKFLLSSGGIGTEYFYYAIDAAYNKGIEESSNTGFRETAYLNLENEIGSFVEFVVYVPYDGPYGCTFGFANGSQNSRPMSIAQNGSAGTSTEFASTGSWTTWDEAGMQLSLKAGRNTIRLTSESAEGGPNFDYLILERLR